MPGLRETILDTAKGTYNGTIVKMAEAIVASFDSILEDAPLEMKAKYLGVEIPKCQITSDTEEPSLPLVTPDSVEDEQLSSEKSPGKEMAESKPSSVKTKTKTRTKKG